MEDFDGYGQRPVAGFALSVTQTGLVNGGFVDLGATAWPDGFFVEAKKHFFDFVLAPQHLDKNFFRVVPVVNLSVPL